MAREKGSKGAKQVAALTHEDWPHRAQADLPIVEFDTRILAPLADLANADRVQTPRD